MTLRDHVRSLHLARKRCTRDAHASNVTCADPQRTTSAHFQSASNPCRRIDGVQNPSASLTNANARTWFTHEAWQRHCPSKARRMPAHIFRHRRGQFWCRDQSFSFTLVVYQISLIPCYRHSACRKEVERPPVFGKPGRTIIFRAIEGDVLSLSAQTTDRTVCPSWTPKCRAFVRRRDCS